MAIIKAINSKASIGKAINYVTKEEKTEEKLISGKDCNPYSAIDEMKATKEQWNKTDGRQYKHYIQSFSPEEKLTPEKAHSIATEWAEKNFKGHETVIATHIDKGHIHNHFIVNSVNFENGKKLQQSKKDLERLKNESDKICERENLSVIKEKGKDITSFNQKKYKAIEKSYNEKESSYLVDTATEVSQSLKTATSKEEFIKSMENKGYKVNWTDTRKYITFTTPDGKKVRNNNLEKTFKEEKFSKESMTNEIQRNREESRGTTETRTGTEIDRTTRTEHESKNGIREHSTQREFGEIEKRLREVEQAVNGNVGNSQQEDRGAETEQRDIKPKFHERDFELER